MRVRTHERGEGRIGLILALAVLAVGVFLAVKFIPVKIAMYEFGDFIEQECRFAAVRTENGEVAKRILDKAAELQLPLAKKDLQIQRTQREMIISAKFEVPIDLKVTTYQYKFQRTERAPLF